MNDRFGAVRALLARGVEEGAFCGAALEVRRESEVLLEARVGTTRRVGGTPVAADTFFDLASVTKVMGTTAAVMRLVAAGRLSPEDRLDRWLEATPDPAKRPLTLAHLLAHASGLPAWRPLFEPLRDLARAGRFAEARRRLLDAAAREPLVASPGTRCEYSDLGFMLLGAVIEAATGLRLDAVWQEEVRQPLGLHEAFWIDLAGSRPPATYAATEDCPWRGRVLEGEVHDDNAWVAGGILGHAGLFATARAVGTFAAAMLAAAAGRSSWLTAEVVRSFWRRDPFGIGATYALGWDTPSASGSQAGTRMPLAVGHLGYTGTSLWIDRARGVAVVLLTNRVHLGRDNHRIQAFRPALHDAVIEALEG